MDIQWNDWRQYLSDAAGVASLLSLLVSAYAVLSVRQVRAELITRFTLPDDLNALKKHATALNVFMQDFEVNKTAISVELEKCAANLRKIRKKVPRQLFILAIGETPTAIIDSLIMRIQMYKGALWMTPKTSKEDVQAIYVSLSGVIEEIKNVSDEQRAKG
jgi:hypothetical protein